MTRILFYSMLFVIVTSQAPLADIPIPRQISFQGVLTDTSGTPVETGTHELAFKLYEASDGGTELWAEDQSVSFAEGSRGLYSVLLGGVTPLDLTFDRQYWLGISVNGGPELVPRVPLTASPYALSVARITRDMSHGELSVGYSGQEDWPLGGVLYLGRFDDPARSGHWLGGVYFVSRTADGRTAVSAVHGRVTDGGTQATQREMTGSLEFLTKEGGQADPSVRMTIDKWGNVGIGTEPISEFQLAVSGGIKAKEIEVSLDGWPDFVFDSDYDLLPLVQVEAFIRKRGHLPDVPSQSELDSRGVNLGEMQATLMRKVEELTLYVIELKNENDHLRSRIQLLEGLASEAQGH